MAKYLVTASWDDCGHLTEEAKATLFASIPVWQRDARTKGIPYLGAGAIYPVSLEDLTIDDIDLQSHWPRAYAFDVGWNKSAVLWGCLNRDTDELFIYSEHYRGEAEPVIHAEAIKARGKWMRGAIDPAARGRGQIDGRNLLQMYQDLGLNLIPADNSVEAGIYNVMMRMSSGRLKIFRSCQNLLAELKLYRRDDKGRVVKSRDHLCDCLRYLVMEMHSILSTQPAPPKKETAYMTSGSFSTGWMS